MSRISRRALARYGADQLIGGQSARQVASRLASVLVEQGLSGELEMLLGDIAWELEQKGELTLSKVTTARALTKALEADLKREIKRATKAREVLVETVVDKAVIGGARIETSRLVVDGTVARQLRNLREAF